MSGSALISIVDDEVSVGEALVGLMQSLGYAAQAFESAEGFLGSDVRDRTDCLIADIHMPGMTGIELAARVAASPTPIPTILMTARYDDSARARLLQTGAVCYLKKPFSEEDLLGCLRAALGKAH